MPDDLFQLAHEAFRKDDAARVRAILESHPELKTRINEVMDGVRSRAMLDVLLDAGADINARSNWWAGSFGILDNAGPELAAYAIERGAIVTVHAAARLGMLDKLKELIAADPSLVHAPGGDGKTPLHFASTVEIAAFLLDHGAAIDALDVDHESTAAQYLVAEHPDVTRYLISRGCKTDILMAAALGDLALVQKHLDADPESIRMRVANDWFPMVGDGKTGGTIYQWVLGWYVSAVQVARKFHHPEVFDFLMDRCPPDEKFLNACWLHDEPLAASLLAQHPNLAGSLPPASRRHVAHAARNNDTTAARLMLSAGFPVDTFSQHHATPLHWASWHGNAELARLLLRHNPPLENSDNQYSGRPIDWALHGSENGWYKEKGDYATTVELLLDAGSAPPDRICGTEAVQAVLRKRA